MADTLDDKKRQQIKELLLKSDPKLNYLLGVPEHEAARKSLAAMGMSDAPLSQLQGIGSAFTPDNSKYQGPASPASQKMGIEALRPAPPDIMRANGPIGSLTPAQIAGNIAEAETMNRAGAGIAKNGFGGLKKLISPPVDEATQIGAKSTQELLNNGNAAKVQGNLDNNVQQLFQMNNDIPGTKVTPEYLDQVRSEIPNINSAIQKRGPVQSGVPDDDDSFSKIKALFNNNN